MGQLGPEGLPAYWEELILALEMPSGHAGAYPEFQCARRFAPALISIIPADLIIRDLRADDSLEELTVMIHAAYKALGDLGLNYTAVDQDVAVTRARIESGTSP